MEKVIVLFLCIGDSSGEQQALSAPSPWMSPPNLPPHDRMLVCHLCRSMHGCHSDVME